MASRPRMAYDVVVRLRDLDIILPRGVSIDPKGSIRAGGTMLEVDPANTDQAKAWGGEGGPYWPPHGERFDPSLARYQPAFLDAAAVTTGDRVLDVGCGTGEETRAAARAGAADALGVASSSASFEG